MLLRIQSTAGEFKLNLPSPPPLTAPEHRGISASAALRRRHNVAGNLSTRRRELLLIPSLAAATALLTRQARAEEKDPVSESPPLPPETAVTEEKKEEEKRVDDDVGILSRVYDATVIGEPQALGKDKKKVWERLMTARIVYMGEAEMVPDKDDRVLELEIVKGLRNRCLEQERPLSVAIEAFPRNLQEQLNQFLDRK